MLRPYIVYFRYTDEGDTKPGPVTAYRLYATSLEEARRLVVQQASYPNIEVLRIVPV